VERKVTNVLSRVNGLTFLHIIRNLPQVILGVGNDLLHFEDMLDFEANEK
jgi:hypothetical protein